MPRWLYHCEVESHVCLAGGVPELECLHPCGTYRVILRDKDVTPGIETPLLDAYVIFEAADIETASAEGRAHLREFLETLTFVTGSRLRHYRDVLLCDWTTGTEMHDSCDYNAVPPPNFPGEVLIPELMQSTSTLLERERPDPVKRALRWFAIGVSAGRPDEQFEWFWLAIEVMAQFTRNVQPVPDTCPVCRGPLYCPKCEETPTHRPFASQAIRELMRQHSEGDADALFGHAFAFRNAMSHGESLKAVEQARGKKVSEVVDELALVAWKAVGMFLVPTLPEGAGRVIRILKPTTYLNRRLRVTAFGAFGTPADREPQLADIPRVELSIIREGGDRTKQTQDPPADPGA